jgi:hypothetical protein
MRLIHRMAVIVLVLAGIPPWAGGSPSHAQQWGDPRQVLSEMIRQLQVGTPNPAWYGRDLWQTIAYQTGNTGVYNQLVQLGPVNNITLAAQVPLPTGMLYGMIVRHQNGVSTWVIGISTVSNRIENANFQIGGTPMPLPSPAPVPRPPSSDALPMPTPARPNPPPNPTPGPATSEACQRFPNLC